MIHKKINLVFLSFLFMVGILVSCQNNKIEFRELDTDAIERLNQNIEVNNVVSAAEIANLFSPKDLVSEGKYTYEVKITENQPDYEIEIKEEGVMDDSLDGIFTIISVKKEDKTWVVTSIKQAYKCKKDRGQQDWGPNFCN